jgi:hypothetical protein
MDMMRRRSLILTLGVLALAGLCGAALASPFHNTDNTRFRTRCNGPQGALLAPATTPGVQALALQPLSAQPLTSGQHTVEGLLRAARPLSLLQAARVKSPRAEARFPRMLYHVDAAGNLQLPALTATAQVTAQQTTPVIGAPTNDLTFAYSGWSTTDQASLQAYLTGAYPKMRQVYGPPAFALTITILQDSTLQSIQGGVYDVTTHTIHMPPLSGNFSEDSFSLCLMVLHAFRSETALYYDAWEEGMAGAAATVVQTLPGVSVGYNPVDPGPFYAWSVYEAENQPGLGNSTFYPASGYEGMLFYRIAMARSVWLKCWAENNNFFSAFNAAYYAAYTSTLPGDVPGLKDVVAQVLPQVEGMSWYDWFQRQYILDTSVHTGLKLYTWNAPTVDSVLLLVEHFLTGTDGDESPRGGSGTLTYWSYDFTTSLYVEPIDTTVTLPATGTGAGEGSLNPTFSSIGDPQCVTVQLDLDGMRGMYPYPYGMRGDNPGQNDFYGAIIGGPQATVAVSGGYTQSGIAATRAVFGACISGSRLVPTQITVRVTNPQSQVVSSTINVGWDSYVAFLQGGGQALLPTHTWTSGTILMSLPVTPLQTNAATVLGLDPTKLLMARWDPSVPPNGAYHIWPNMENFTPGHAYWLKLTSSLTLSVQGLLPAEAQTYPVPVPLGWNMVGSPRQAAVPVANLQVQVGNNAPIAFSDAVNQGLVQKGFYAYAPGTGYTITDILTPFDGFWLRCLVPGGIQLIFPAVTP